MPSLQLTTNVKVEDRKPFVLELSKFAAETLAKPEQYISINYTYDEFLTFAGSCEPAFLLTIHSLGNINPTLNEKYSVAIFAWLEKKLGIPGDRGYISFFDPGRAYMGHKGTTFETIFGKE